MFIFLVFLLLLAVLSDKSERSYLNDGNIVDQHRLEKGLAQGTQP